MASDAKAMPLTLSAADLLDRLATAYAELEPGPYTDRDGMIGSARRLAALLRQDYAPPAPAPDAGGGAAFVDAVDRMDEASSRLAILCATGALEGPEFRAADDALTTARAALLAAHAAAAQPARAVPDRAAVEAARGACEQAAVDASRAGALWTVGLRDARRAFDVLLYGDSPADDDARVDAEIADGLYGADAADAGEAVRDGE